MEPYKGTFNRNGSPISNVKATLLLYSVSRSESSARIKKGHIRLSKIHISQGNYDVRSGTLLGIVNSTEPSDSITESEGPDGLDHRFPYVPRRYFIPWRPSNVSI